MSIKTIVPEAHSVSEIQQAIRIVRGRRVILDADLARFYGAATGDINRAVLRNQYRFPEDFAFRLTPEEAENLKYQIGTSSSEHGGRRGLTQAFTEQGVAMLASVLRTPRAVSMSIAIVRAFVRLREIIGAHKELAVKLAELESRLEKHDQEISDLFETIRQLIAPPDPKSQQKIGFHQGNR